MSWAGWIVWNSIPDSDLALPKYKFKNTLQSRLLGILIQEDTYVGVRALFDKFSKYWIFILISFIPCFIYLFWNKCFFVLLIANEATELRSEVASAAELQRRAM